MNVICPKCGTKNDYSEKNCVKCKASLEPEKIVYDAPRDYWNPQRAINKE